ncbi:hypothetical protein [Simiduia aestuariiviva]|uniref:Uncharacterized protein n=1 Tax=Simiduia aestuariiviva TaxID=1510459 RepID=A0A839UR76_9GAMM|nr:hypothetical protein [Simiduia aestuariiviva]MBB3167907.1 hypothetical protein [Simiduia aestuariiviva]
MRSNHFLRILLGYFSITLLALGCQGRETSTITIDGCAIAVPYDLEKSEKLESLSYYRFSNSEEILDLAAGKVESILESTGADKLVDITAKDIEFKDGLEISIFPAKKLYDVDLLYLTFKLGGYDFLVNASNKALGMSLIENLLKSWEKNCEIR